MDSNKNSALSAEIDNKKSGNHDIIFQNVSMVYEDDGTAALNNVSLTIKQGEYVFITGKSGAGKTSLTKLLFCEERINSGKLIVNGHDLSKLPKRKIPYFRRTLGVVFQDFRLFKNQTVYENVAFALRAISADPKIIKKRATFFLKRVDMLDKSDRFPDKLSGGEKQRVAFARALVNEPDIIIADEPTGNLDKNTGAEIMDLLEVINSMLHKTVIVVTHDLEMVKRYNHRVINIENGEITSDRYSGGGNA